MKKNSSMSGTLNRLFGKKNANNNSLYANPPPWILAQGAKDYTDDVHGSFAFLDDSGTATLRSRPGHRVRPVLQFSTSNTDAQGLAVPTPSVPLGFTDNASIGNGPKLNGNYRMCSSAGDLHLVNYYNDDFEDIPAPPSMPPPPPPNMAPPPPPQKSPPSSAISSPSSPSPPDFIPPIPNSSAPGPPNFLVNQFAGPTAEQQTNNVAKWKSEIALNAGSKDLPMTLPNRLSLNPAAFQYTQGQSNFDAEPRSTLPRTFKMPPPAPARTSSIQSQEPQNIGYKDPPQSPVPSSFNPTFQAKLFASRQGEQSLDTLNKRKSVLIMEDLPDLMENSDQRIEKSSNVTNSAGSKAVSTLKESTHVQNPQVELKKQIKSEDALNKKMEPASIFQENQPYQLTSVPAKHEEEQKYSQNGTERNTLTSKHGFIQEVHPTSKPTVKIISLKPIIGELALLNPNGSKQDSISRKEPDVLSQELTKMDNEVKPKPERSLENVNERPPSPPLMAPPPPPTLTVSPNRQSITPLPLPGNGTPPKSSSVINSTVQPPAPLFNPATISLMTSPVLPPKPKTITVTPKPQALVPPPPIAPAAPPPPIALAAPPPPIAPAAPPPPIAPAAPPPLPSTVGPTSSVPLLEALQAKQQTLRKIPKSIEVRPAQKSSISDIDDEQKIRVGKIKSELEALFSPKKDEGVEKLKKPCPDPDANKNSNGNLSLLKGGENKLVSSLMLKVPLLPAKFENDDDVDSDNSEWMPKSNNLDIPLPEPDYLPKSAFPKTEKPTYSEIQNKIPKATLEISVPPSPVASSQDTDTADVMESSIPTYKPHRKTQISTESSTFDELPVVSSKPEADVGINLYSIPQSTETAASRLSMKEEPLSSRAESTNKYPTTGEKVEANSPMALLMAAQKRAQKAKSLERTNLPKISVTNGLVTSSSPSPYTERKVNSFVVVPNQDKVGQFTEEEVTSFTSNSSHGSTSMPSAWRDVEPQSSGIRRTFDRNFENQIDQSSTPYVYNSPAGLESTIDGHEEYVEPKSARFNDQISTTVPNATNSSTFNLSSFPSPTPKSKMMSYEMEYGIIPPPEEFMNSPVGSNSNLNSIPQEDRSYNFDYNTNNQFDVIPNYNRNNSVIQPFPSLSTSSNSGFSNYNDNYSMAAKDSQRGSLIKKRLYMPEPESSRNYGLNTSSRSSTMPLSYSSMHAQSSLNMVPDSWRSNTMSRFVPQGRRVSSENASRTVPSMMDMKYRSQNSDFSLETSSTRSQSKYQQGMTFTVRPGTRQPISQIYQGGYL